MGTDTCEWRWPSLADSAEHIASMKAGQRSPKPLTVTFKTSAMEHAVEIAWSNAPVLASKGDQIVAAIDKCRDFLGVDAVTVINQPEVVGITATKRDPVPHVEGKIWAVLTHVYNKYVPYGSTHRPICSSVTRGCVIRIVL